MNNEISFDALPPPSMAAKAEGIGIKKAGLDILTLFALAILAGAFIAVGAIFCTTVLAGTSTLPYGVGRFLGGLAFTTGLILVVVGGAELFTGNNLIIMAFASRKVTFASLMRNWIIVYVGNFVGSVATAYIMFQSQQYTFGANAIGLTALNIGNFKCGLGFIQAVALGIMCNALVCLAVWLCYSARSTADKIFSIIPPIAAFVAAGFEHSVANMYFIPIALFVKFFNPTFYTKAVEVAGKDFSNLTWGNFLGGNLLPVTIGNIIGGAVMVGLVYWFAYLRTAKKS